MRGKFEKQTHCRPDALRTSRRRKWNNPNPQIKRRFERRDTRGKFESERNSKFRDLWRRVRHKSLLAWNDP